jgi:hypothetical protein
MTASHPLCFILLPFGTKPDASGALIDFDAVYTELIIPAVREAELEPLRADEENAGGIIHKPMFERLLLSEYAIVDLTTANANVFYELGVRHAVRPHSTTVLFAEGRRLPFDVSMIRALSYRLDEFSRPASPMRFQARLTELLEEAKNARTDSPVFTLVSDWKPPEIDHTKTDTFRERVQYSETIKSQLAKARMEGVAALVEVEAALGKIEDQDSGVVIDLFLSYRAVKAWTKMVELVQKMSPPLQATVMVREQLALALNRAGDSEAAERILLALIKQRGPSSETCSILGRVYKDQWDAALNSGNASQAAEMLSKAIDAYLGGFEADWRDAYPGINAITLMELREPPDERREQILPVVRYAVERRIASGQPDYWDFATLLELAVLGRDERRARAALADAVTSIREAWEPETTARNLRLIREARERRQELAPWMREIENELQRLSHRTSTSV